MNEHVQVWCIGDLHSIGINTDQMLVTMYKSHGHKHTVKCTSPCTKVKM